MLASSSRVRTSQARQATSAQNCSSAPRDAEFHTEARESGGTEGPGLKAGVTRRRRREGVDDEPTAVAGAFVIALLGIGPFLDGTVDADWVRDRSSFPTYAPCPGR